MSRGCPILIGQPLVEPFSEKTHPLPNTILTYANNTVNKNKKEAKYMNENDKTVFENLFVLYKNLRKN